MQQGQAYAGKGHLEGHVRRGLCSVEQIKLERTRCQDMMSGKTPPPPPRGLLIFRRVLESTPPIQALGMGRLNLESCVCAEKSMATGRSDYQIFCPDMFWSVRTVKYKIHKTNNRNLAGLCLCWK